jgi:peptide/nickel transport system substrate-binding protein
MKNKIISILVVLMATSFLLSTLQMGFATPARDKYPRLDTAYGVVSYPEATAMGLARAGTIDNLMGMINADNVEELAGGSSFTTGTARPDGAGASTQWTPNGAVANWDCVNEAASDGDGTYVSATINNTIDDYTTSDPAGTGTITRVRLYVVAKWVNTTLITNLRDRLIRGAYIGGVLFTVSAATLTTSYASYMTEWVTNPNTGVGWTQANVDGLKAYIKSDVSSDLIFEEIRVTQVYFEVTYRQGSVGWSISANPGFHMCNFGINCRPVTAGTDAGGPSTGGVTADYNLGGNGGPRTAGWPLYPLNITEFRYALNLLIGCQKTAWIASLYRFINVRLDTTIPPASVYWFNSALPPVPYDPTLALATLTGAGFSNSTGKWICPNGQELRRLWVMCPTEAPPTVTLAGYAVTSWNAFFGTGTLGAYFIHYPLSFYDELDFAFINRDYDIYIACWGLGRNPDYLFDFFHPDADIRDGSNSPGLSVPILNDVLYAIKYWQFPNGTKITNFNEMRDNVTYAQSLLYVLTPYIPMYSRAYYNAYTPGLACWTESLGYGSNNGYTYNYITWRNPNGTVDTTKASWKFHISGPLAALNPITSSSAYDWQVINRALDGLLDINPYLHSDILSLAKAWDPLGGYYAYSSVPEEVPDGMRVNFTLRPGLKWQDGAVYDANDAKWNLDFIDSIEPGRYYDIYNNYIKSVVSTTTYTDDTIMIYINATSLWLLYSFAGSVAVVPPQIYGPLGPVDTDLNGVVTLAEVTAFQPSQTVHPTNSSLKCLIGTGAWIFKEFDVLTQTVRLDANTAYWARTFRREDINFDGVVNLFDAVKLSGAAGADPTHARWNHGEADLNCDEIVNLFDAVLLSGKAGVITLPGYP